VRVDTEPDEDVDDDGEEKNDVQHYDKRMHEPETNAVDEDEDTSDDGVDRPKNEAGEEEFLLLGVNSVEEEGGGDDKED